MIKLSVKFYMIILMLTFIVVFASKANAQCSINPSTQEIHFPSATIMPSQRGSAGTVLYSVTLSVGQINFNCGTNLKSTWRSAFARPEANKTSLANVYATNVAGIGLRIKWPLSRAENAWVPGNYSCLGNCVEPADKILLELVQTGVTANSTIPAGLIASIFLSADNDPTNKVTLLNIYSGEITVAVRSCAIYASSNSVDLGTYSLADVAKAKFTGDKKDFSITLDCPQNTSAKITFEGRTAWGMGTGIIENSGDAKNAYIKLYQKSGQRYTARALNTAASFGSSASFTGVRTVTYAGEMYFDDSTRAIVTAGSVAANIIYTLTLN